MSWGLLSIVLFAHVLALVALRQRSQELARMRGRVSERDRARERGSHKARLQYPHVDLSACIGCGSCVRACPEENVLDLVHGQAVVVHGARCVGHGLCARECPTGAIAVTLQDIARRRDIPVLTDELEVPRRARLFLAGEVTGYSLVRTAIAHGASVAETVKRELTRSGGGSRDDVLDLCIVGVGPAGLACSLRAKELGLRHVALEREELGGTVAKYPRRKLVMTQPVELPGYGRLTRTTYTKEELMDLWREVAAAQELPVVCEEELVSVEPEDAEGVMRVNTRKNQYLARNVCIAIGRRGIPRKLGVPGEEKTKVAYGLVDAQSYAGRRGLVVGGGDSAVEAALALAEQEGSDVTLSYRKAAFTRIKVKNEERLERARREGRLRVLTESQVLEVRDESVVIMTGEGTHELPNDDVFVLIGGEPPFDLLERSGVSFDPSEREPVVPPTDEGKGLQRALAVSLALASGVLGWRYVLRDYYNAPMAERVARPEHELLHSSGTVGLALGVVATLLIGANLAYLLRRSRLGARIPGSLRQWMTSHVVTGILGFLLVFVHAGMRPADTVGGHAFWALLVLVVTGAIGRYLYAFVPRSANGRELLLEEIRPKLAALSAEWDGIARGRSEPVREEVERIATEARWEPSFLRRVAGFLRDRRKLEKALRRMRAEAGRDGLPAEQIQDLADLARRAFWTSSAAAHLEDMRGLIATWRYLHRWIALLMCLLALVHIVIAVRFGGVFG